VIEPSQSKFVMLIIHDSGKALRTVKSCVGTTWCRFGIGDSVGSSCNAAYVELQELNEMYSGYSS
jgi:NAD(P)H-nitrite reductase large subunit